MVEGVCNQLESVTSARGALFELEKTTSKVGASIN